MATPILLSLGNIAGSVNGQPNPFSEAILFAPGSVVLTQDGEQITETDIAGYAFPLNVDAITLQDPTDFAFVNATVNGVVQVLPFAVHLNDTVVFNFTRTTAGDPVRFQATVTIL